MRMALFLARIMGAGSLAALVLAHPGPVGATPEMPGEADLAGATDDERCLTFAIAYEAGDEPAAGQAAVADVILNRRAAASQTGAKSPSLCAVVLAGALGHLRVGLLHGRACQFTFACDGALARRLDPRTIRAAWQVARAALARTRDAAPGAGTPLGGALHYHATYVHPAWAGRMALVARIGAHVFYRGAPSATRAPMLFAGRDGEPGHALIARLFGGGLFGRESVPPAADPAGTPGGEPPFAPWGLGAGPPSESSESHKAQPGGATLRP